MKTVNQIAQEIGVSKQAVWKKIKGQLMSDLQNCMTTKGNTVYISVDGENIIKQTFNTKSPTIGTTTDTPTNVNQVLTDENQITTKLIDSLQLQIETLTQFNKELRTELSVEREHSRQQADRLSNIAEQLAELSRNNQILLSAEQTRTNPTLLINKETPESPQNDFVQNETKQKKSFWNLFKNKTTT